MFSNNLHVFFEIQKSYERDSVYHHATLEFELGLRWPQYLKQTMRMVKLPHTINYANFFTGLGHDDKAE